MTQWYNALWQHRQTITINHEKVDEPIQDYILFLNETGFSKPGQDNDVFDRARADGRDIIITSGDGITKLPFELVSYSSINKKLEIYIKLSLLSSISDTNLYIYYGNPVHTEPYSNSIWNNYQYVSHDGGKTDVLGNVNSTTFGSPEIVEGLLGSGVSFNNPGDIYDTGISSISLPLTFQVLVKPQSFTGPFVLGNNNNSNQDFYLYTQNNQWIWYSESGGGAHGFGMVVDNQWNHLGLKIDSSFNSSFYNGEAIGNISSNGANGTISTGTNLKINDDGSTVNSSGGLVVDEIRIFNGLLSDAYISVEFKNHNEPSSFYSISAQQEVSGAYVSTSTGSLFVTGFSPTVSVGAKVNIPLGQINITGFSPSIGTGVDIHLNVSDITIQPFVMAVDANEHNLIGSYIDFSLPKFGSGKKFRPIRPFELFKEGRPDNKDSQLFSRLISETINIGGVVCYIWKLEGTFNQVKQDGSRESVLDEADGEVDDLDTFLGIQDNILGENRDRKYSEHAIRLKGTYAVSDNELEYARFGMALMNDLIQIEFSKADMVKAVDRFLMPGDVVEFVHLTEVGIEGSIANRFYEVDNIARSPSGFDMTYQYHVIAATMRPLRDAQEFIDLMERTDEYGKPLRDNVSNSARMLASTAHLQHSANEQAYTTNYDTTPLYINDEGAIVPHMWTDDLNPPNGRPVQQVSEFPLNPSQGDYVVRVDMFPNRLYRYQSGRWMLKEKDGKREWGTYNWTRRLRSFMSDQSTKDDMRPWELKSIHDILTPRQGSSNPSPKGNEEIVHSNIFNWDRMIEVETPEVTDSDPIERQATLIPTNTFTTISDFLNAQTGQYSFFLIFYVIKRGNNQETGEMLINDDGSNIIKDHEFTTIGDVGVQFELVYENGFRKLKYIMSEGSAAVMTFFVKDAW